MRREIGVAQHTNGTTNGTDELQLIELVDEGTYGKVFKGASHLHVTPASRCLSQRLHEPVACSPIAGSHYR